MFRRRSRRSTPDDDQLTESDTAVEDAPDDDRSGSEGRNGPNWLSDLPDIRYPAMEHIRDDPAARVAPPPRRADSPTAAPTPLRDRDRPGLATESMGDGLIAQAAAAFEAVEESSSVAIARIKESQREAELGIEQIATHREAALERAVTDHSEELSQLRDELRDELRASMIDVALQFEQRVAAISDTLARAHGDELDRLRVAQIPLLEQSARDANEQIEAARLDATTQIEQVERDVTARLRRIAARQRSMQRVNVVGLALVAALAVAGLVLAARAGGDVERPRLGVEPTTTTTTRLTTTTTAPAATTLPPASGAVPPPSSPATRATTPPTATPPPTAPPPTPPTTSPLCSLLPIC
jgi:hypothetical protein